MKTTSLFYTYFGWGSHQEDKDDDLVFYEYQEDNKNLENYEIRKYRIEDYPDLVKDYQEGAMKVPFLCFNDVNDAELNTPVVPQENIQKTTHQIEKKEVSKKPEKTKKEDGEQKTSLETENWTKRRQEEIRKRKEEKKRSRREKRKRIEKERKRNLTEVDQVEDKKKQEETEQNRKILEAERQRKLKVQKKHQISQNRIRVASAMEAKRRSKLLEEQEQRAAELREKRRIKEEKEQQLEEIERLKNKKLPELPLHFFKYYSLSNMCDVNLGQFYRFAKFVGEEPIIQIYKNEIARRIKPNQRPSRGLARKLKLIMSRDYMINGNITLMLGAIALSKRKIRDGNLQLLHLNNTSRSMFRNELPKFN